MLAIITFFSALILAITPNTDSYQTILNTNDVNTAIESESEMITDWKWDSEHGWFFELPEIEITGTTEVTTAGTWEIHDEYEWIYELPMIEVRIANS